MNKIIEMPKNLQYNYDSYDYLTYLQHQIAICPEDKIILDFQKIDSCHTIFMTFIGFLSVWANHKNKQLVYRLSKKTKLYEDFHFVGLYNYLTGNTTNCESKNAIPFREVKMDDEEILDYINNILELAPIKLTSTAENLLFKTLYEIFNNSVEHSNSQDGVYACGHWAPEKKELDFSVYDTGVGIPFLIKQKINANFSSKDALEWSLVPGNSTKQLIEGIPRGVGLSDLKKFIELNNGSFNIVSNDIYYNYENTNEIYRTINNPISGTIISFIIKNDDTHIYGTKRR